ncbi:MAG: hypothetical protein CRN43_03765 [Candidatus Nephrothrix sp. EaCA]|nr:MAG: hypothetical protein CRN43_03765 [Candidatus Nephrothrix sp. EaCA]
MQASVTLGIYADEMRGRQGDRQTTAEFSVLLLVKLSVLALTFLFGVPASAQLFLDNRQLLASPGTYGDDISLSSAAALRISGTGVYVLGGVLLLRGGDAQSRALSAVNKYHYDNGRRANSLLDTAASSGAGRYYSSGNDIANPYKDAVPKAEGYAYSQTEYTRDGTGRVSRQGGVGKELRIDGSRAVRHYYGSAAQEELRRLFGDKIGKASHYKKDVSVDANGQASVSYKDQEGRIAATALAGGSPSNTEELASFAAQTGTPVRLRLDDKNSKRAGASETVHTFINVAPNACGYKLTVSLTDPNGDKADLGSVSGDEDTGPSYVRTLTAASCAENAEHVIRFTGVRLSEVGDYTIRKVLVPTVLSYEQIRESVRRLPATAAYRETIKAANPPDLASCEECRACDNAALINISLDQIAKKGCDKIRDSIESNYKRDHPGVARMPASHLYNPSNDPLICKYNYCRANERSTVFDFKLAMVKNWTEAQEKYYGRVESLIAADPFFDGGSTLFSHGWHRKNDMVARMGQILVPDLDIGKSQSARQDMSGPIDDVTDPDASRYFIDRYGRPNASGRHFLYYELKTRLAQDSITRAEYEKQLGEQRWAMFRHYYQEGKRQIKISENRNCASMLSELQAQDALPDTKDKMINKARGQHDAYRRIQAKMTVLAIKRSCAPGLTRADSTALGNSLFEYFKSTPYNYMCVIDSADLASDAAGRLRNRHLEQFRVLLETNYAGCRLGVFAARNPFKCLRDTTVYMDVPPPEPLSANRAPARGMSEEEKRREEEMGRELERMEAFSERAESGRQSEASTGMPVTARSSPASEVNALIDFYNAARGRGGGGEGEGSGWTRHDHWQPNRIEDGTSLYIGNWYGVTINGAGNVIALELNDNNLTGRLTDTLTACPRLAKLLLFNNKLTGNPTALGRMPQLSELDLGSNLLSGSLAGRSADRSAGFLSAFFPGMRYLTLSNNQLTGRLEELGQMPHLIKLNLGSNKLTGILTELQRMPGLAELELYNNRLEGNLSALASFSKLRILNLSKNEFTGDLAALRDLTRLRKVWLYENQLEGGLSFLSACHDMESVNLSKNRFSGNLSGLRAMSRLSFLNLGNNQFSGDLSALASCRDMEVLNLSKNGFSGNLTALERMAALTHVYLQDNLFSGSLSSLSNSRGSLIDLFVYNNKFTFADLEGSRDSPFSGSSFGVFYYSPQDSVDVGQIIKCTPGVPVALSSAIDRNTALACKHNWYKEHPVKIVGAETPSIDYMPHDADHGKKIYYTVTHDGFPALTLTSRKRKVAAGYTYCINWRICHNCSASKLWDFDSAAERRKCRLVQQSLADHIVDRLVNEYIDQKTTEHILQRDFSCLQNVNETLSISYINKEYHYTLYYYDQAGNLVQTVPPQGVRIAENGNGNPAHTLKTAYRYNAQNQIISQTAPDAGTTNFYYNRKGQLRFSQNAQQAIDRRYAYSKYDAQGRITETGEASQVDLGQIENSQYPEANRADVASTHYDAPAPKSPVLQEYLRSRVSYTETIERNASDTVRTYYSYDPHGNVNLLLQKIPGLPPKTTHYRYDLISGKVNYVFYQYGQPDQFVHRYTYDSDNRIKEVLTSSDRYVWHKDARYSYYLHGPLALTELGHWRNQQLRYAYTLQGWIKSVNAAEPSNNAVGKNVMSYQLGYFKNDYKPIGPSTQNDVSLWTRAEENIGHQGMYNGNISWMETNITPFGKQAMLYKYDQLNRITKSRSLAFGNNAYAARSGEQKYDEDYSYDANGNILTLKRHDDKAAVMDDFNYSYYANTNRLLKHKTAGGAYEYDAIGNLVKDNNENLSIAWTPSGKVRSVVKPDTTIYFRYDAMGNRVAKIVSTPTKSDTTAYARDASGNVMTIYDNRTATEAPIYGSGRIGEYMGREKEGYQTFNLRKYELTNHLGNVLAVISDKVNLYGHNNILDSARATVMSASDYYPFGLPMLGRNIANASTYSHGFQGQFSDKDMETQWNVFELRSYDSRLTRWTNPDPYRQYASPYLAMSNNPISMVDPDGGFDTKFGAWLYTVFHGGKVSYNDAGYWQVNRKITESFNGISYLGVEVAVGRGGFRGPALNLFDYGLAYTRDFSGGISDFAHTYNEMKESNWKLSDKYFHSKANFKATMRGPGGEYAAEKMSNLREIFDQKIKRDEREWSEQDQVANRYGREQGQLFRKKGKGAIDYREALPLYRPPALPSKY